MNTHVCWGWGKCECVLVCVLCLRNMRNCGYDHSREFRKAIEVEGGKRARRVSTTRPLVKIISAGEQSLPMRDWSPSLTGLTKGVFISRTLWLFSLHFYFFAPFAPLYRRLYISTRTKIMVAIPIAMIYNILATFILTFY